MPRDRTSCLVLWFVLLCCYICLVECRCYYDILGVSKGATPQDIKKAYRKKALKHHPDKGGKESDFKEINKAYEILSDDTQKEIYDNYGEAGISNGGPSAANFQAGSNPFAGGNNPFGGAGGNPFQSFFSQGGGPGQQGFSFHSSGGNGNVNIDLSEILQQMMGGGNTGFQQPGQGGYTNNKSYTKKVSCTLAELANGATKKLKVNFGNGIPEKVYPIQLKKGWKAGTKITFPAKDGYPSMVFVIEEVPHKYLRRDGNNLHYTCWISESQTNGGIVVKVPLPSGDVWSKSIPKSATDESSVLNGQQMTIHQKGMPIKGGPDRGDLIVEFRVRRSAKSPTT